MSIDCPWSIYSTLLSLTFYIPFKTKHSLLSAGNRSATIIIVWMFFGFFSFCISFLIWFQRCCHFVLLNQQCLSHFIFNMNPPNPLMRHLAWPHRKYIQVCVQNVSDANFTLAELKLTEKQHASLELQSLNTKKQQVSRKKLNRCQWPQDGSAGSFHYLKKNGLTFVRIYTLMIFRGNYGEIEVRQLVLKAMFTLMRINMKVFLSPSSLPSRA